MRVFCRGVVCHLCCDIDSMKFPQLTPNNYNNNRIVKMLTSRNIRFVNCGFHTASRTCFLYNLIIFQHYIYRSYIIYSLVECARTVRYRFVFGTRMINRFQIKNDNTFIQHTHPSDLFKTRPILYRGVQSRRDKVCPMRKYTYVYTYVVRKVCFLFFHLARVNFKCTNIAR